ncbi:MAG: hypothetical protein ABI699_15675 [Caldimonas sp.]
MTLSARALGLAHVAFAALLALASAGPAAAAPSEVSAAGFLVSLRYEVKAAPGRLWQALGEVDRWWNPSHTWSGSSANLSLSREAPGCFCERWEAGSVEHGRVIHAARDSLLRVQGALGPLQALAVDGVLSFAIAEKEGKTILQVSYRVSGNDAAGLQQYAAAVDGVIAEQARRLVAYAESGKPD